MDVAAFWALILPLFRALSGWLVNAWADQKIDWPEWRKLIETMGMLGFPILIVALGANMANWENDIVYIVAMILVVGDMIRSNLKKKVTTGKKSK